MSWAGQAWRGARWALVTEWRMYVGTFRLLARRPDIPPGTTPVRYVGAVALALWAFTALSVVELVVLHVVIPWETVRLVADVLGIWGVVWILGMTGCHYVYPHLLTSGALRVRNTQRHDLVTLPWPEIERVGVRERSFDTMRRLAVDPDDPAVLHVPVGSRTNVDVRLRQPVTVEVRGTSYAVTEVRLFADDPRALAADLRSRTGGGARRPQ